MKAKHLKYAFTMRNEELGIAVQARVMKFAYRDYEIQHNTYC